MAQDFSRRWTNHLRETARTTVFPCVFCPEQPIYTSEPERWTHVETLHAAQFPVDVAEVPAFRAALPRELTLSPSHPAERSLNVRRRRPSSKGHGQRPLTAITAAALSSDVATLTARTAGHPDLPAATAPTSEHPSAQLPRKPSSRTTRGSPTSSNVARVHKSRPASSHSGRSGRSHDAADTPSRPPVKGNKQLFDPAPHRRANSMHDIGATTAGPRPATATRAIWKRPELAAVSTPPLSLPSPVLSSASHAPTHLPKTFPASVLAADPHNLYLQPETRKISQEQLVAEVKGIYAGLVMVEAKCIEVDDKQAAQTSQDGEQPKLNNDQWQALIALHRTLLYEHHDFFLASQHPSSSPALQKLASKYAMPARMWRHGIHSFLELLRRRLPQSREHMLTFVCLAYSMVALLYETVPAFEETWIECLGDLARYRMAIEDDDLRERDVWTGVARYWYFKASDKNPAVGRLYHHIAILARPNQLQQLFFYAKSLTVSQPFVPARESIGTLFDQSLAAAKQNPNRQLTTDLLFVRLHAMLFRQQALPAIEQTMGLFTTGLWPHIERLGRRFTEQGYHMAIALVASVQIYDARLPDPKSNSETTKDESVDVAMSDVTSGNAPGDAETWQTDVETPLTNVEILGNTTIDVVLQRPSNPNILSFVHVILLWVYGTTFEPTEYCRVEATFPWRPLVTFVNVFLRDATCRYNIDDEFPVPEGTVRPLPEDFATRGLAWAQRCFPPDFFEKLAVDDEERYLEKASMMNDRHARIIWLALRITIKSQKFCFDDNRQRFYLHGQTWDEVELDSKMKTGESPTTEEALTAKEAVNTGEARKAEEAPVEPDVGAMDDRAQPNSSSGP